MTILGVVQFTVKTKKQVCILYLRNSKFLKMMKYFYLMLFSLVCTTINAQLEISNLSETQYQANVLRYYISFETNEPAEAYVEWYRQLDDLSLELQHSAIQSGGTSHSFQLIGFVPDETYFYRAFAWNPGSCDTSEYKDFITSSLPSDVSTITNIYTTTPDLEGYFMTNNVSTADKTIQIFNRSGEVVWYDWHSGVDNAGGIQNCQMWDVTDEGNTITFECHSLEERDLFGNVIASVDFNGTFYDTLFFHHDAIKNSLGHYVAIGAELRYFDFTSNGGISNQPVVGEALLEFDADGNVFWFWSSFDHYDVVAMNVTNQNAFFTPMFGPTAINWQHCNSVHEDYDGDYLISCKELNQILKIDRTTGDIIWKISGSDPTIALQNDGGFGDQHDLSNLDPNKYILYDNTGAGANSRLVEFAIDYYEVPTAYKTWEYVIGDSIASPILGTARRLPNGNRMGVCGAPGSNPANKGHIIEVTEEGEVVWHAKQSSWIYRSYYYDQLFNNDDDLVVDITTEVESSYCPGHTAFNLSAEPTGGCWLGPGVTNNSFDPSSAGEGTHTIYYQYAWLTDSIQINVQQSPVQTEFSYSICFGDSIFAGGDWQTVQGIYIDSLLTVQGCDSIVSTDLIVNPIEITDLSIEICQGDSAFLEGSWQTEQGYYVDVLSTALGCDSALVTQLIVNPLPSQPTIEFVSGGGMEQTIECSSAADAYLWYFDGELQEDITNGSINTGDYDLGESATIQVVIVNNGCASEVSDPYFIIGIAEINLFDIRIIPNPASERIYLWGDLAGFGLTNMRIYDLRGTLILHQPVLSGAADLDISGLANGLYRLQLTGENAHLMNLPFVVE